MGPVRNSLDLKIGSSTIFAGEKLYFVNAEKYNKISIYDIKGRLIWDADLTDTSKCIPQVNNFYIKPDVINGLTDGLYIVIFSSDTVEPMIKKFNKVSKTKK